MTDMPTTFSSPENRPAKTVYARQIENYFAILRSVVEDDPRRLSGVVEYVTNPNNVEGIFYVIPREAQTLLKEAAIDAEQGQKGGALHAIAKAEVLTNEELGGLGNLYIASSTITLKPQP